MRKAAWWGVVAALAVLAWLAYPPLAMAQEHGGGAVHGAEGGAQAEGGHEDTTTLWKWVNFALLAGVGLYFGVKKGGPYFRGKRQQIAEAIAEAARLKHEAENRYRAMEARLARLEDEIARLREDSRKEWEREAERLAAETREQIEKAQAAGRRDIAAAARAAQQKVRAWAAAEAVKLAEAKLKARLDEAGDEALRERFLEGMRQGAPVGRR